jgi:hypothetical protein
MQQGTFFMAPIQSRVPSPLYGIEPQNLGNGEIESLHSYILAVAHAHSVAACTLVQEIVPSADRLTGKSIDLPWGWDKDRGLTLLGPTELAAQMSSLFAAASGREAVRWTTLAPAMRHICGQGLIASTERVCLDCLKEDREDGRLPYGRLLWRLEAVDCCPRHKVNLVPASCGKFVDRRNQYGRRKLGGSCGVCGALAYRCITDTTSTPGPNELWRAQQCADMLVALPQISTANPLAMKDAVAAYCSRADGPVKLAQRINVPKSSMSRWLNKAAPRISLSILLDIAASEGFSLSGLLLGDLSRVAHPPEVEPVRNRRPTKRLNHFVVESALKAAIADGVSIQELATELRVDPGTLARHEELYGQLRDLNQIRNRELQAASYRTAILEAEQTLLSLIRIGRTPSLRNAAVLTQKPWWPAQLKSVALLAMRAQLGHAHLRSFGRATVSNEFRELVACAADRVRSIVASRQQSLLN